MLRATTGATLTGIFISYRREDASGWAGRLQDALRREFPANDVFYDIGSIEIGEDFLEAMRRALSSCGVVIVLIGPRWLDARDEAGRRRLDDPEDWVRLEVAEGLQRPGLRVVPVLVGTATMPKAADLPEPLRSLARRNAHEISDKRWEYDVGQLVVALRKIPALAEAEGAVGGAGADAARAEPGRVTQTPAGPRTEHGVAPGTTALSLSPGTVFRDGEDCPEMVVIPAGEFLMGSPKGEQGRYGNEGPQHKVTIGRPIAVGKYAVTFDEWDACVAAQGCSHSPDDLGWGRGRRPVINVSWQDAQEYVSWLSTRTGKSYRLLSEAEWEYAARAGTTTRYPWGDAPGKNLANFVGSGSRWTGKQTAPVGSFPANGFGLYDMIGNVWAWVQDCWNESYDGAPPDGLAWEGGDCGRRVLRGGSWSTLPVLARAACRYRDGPADRGLNVGFRLARTL